MYFDAQRLCDCLADLPSEELATPKNRQVVKEVIQDAAGNSAAVVERMMNLYGANYGKAIDGVFHSPKHGEQGYGHATLFERNVAQMSAYKAQQLADELAKLKGRPDFDKLAEITIKKYNRYQAVEYNTIMARSRSAKQWELFQRVAHLYQNIEWLRTRSSTPRERHLAYAGRVWAKDDPFWNANQPGNLYGCKCDWRPTDKSPANGNFDTVTPSPGLDGNPYNTFDIFTQEHPYFAGGDKITVNRAMAKMKPEAAYRNTTASNGKEMRWNIMHEKDAILKNLEVANDLMNLGYDRVDILPDIHPKDAALRKPFLPEGYEQRNPKKNPEAVMYKDGKAMVSEFKVLDGYRNIVVRIKEALRQADYVVVKLKFKGVDKGSIKRKVDRIMSENKELKGVIVLNENVSVLYQTL